MSARTHRLLDELRGLAADDGRPDLARIDRALQDGCARKLGIETARLRLERRLRDAASGGARGSADVSRVSQVLSRREAELSALASLIAALRARRSALLAG